MSVLSRFLTARHDQFHAYTRFYLRQNYFYQFSLLKAHRRISSWSRLFTVVLLGCVASRADIGWRMIVAVVFQMHDAVIAHITHISSKPLARLFTDTSEYIRFSTSLVFCFPQASERMLK